MHYFYDFINSTLPAYHSSFKEDHIELTIEVPGVKKEDISIEHREDDRTLLISCGERKYHYTITVPVEAEQIEATLDLGILTVILPRKNKSTKIQVR
jgi:HSP20 family molecular chaperone IbpA